MTSDIPGEPQFFKTTTGEMKIPDPMTTPIIWAAPSKSPNFFGSKLILGVLASFWPQSDMSVMVFSGFTIMITYIITYLYENLNQFFKKKNIHEK